MKLFTKRSLIIILLMCAANFLYAQSLAINSDGSSADVSAILDVQSTTKGLLTPKMTLLQRSLISSPATGLVIYQTDGTPGFYYNAGTSIAPYWVQLLPSNGSGASLTNLNATNLSSGTVASARLGSGTASSSNFLRGDGTWANANVAGILPNAFYGHLTNASIYYYNIYSNASSSTVSGSLLNYITQSTTVNINIYSYIGAAYTISLEDVTPASGATWTLSGTTYASASIGSWSSGSPVTATLSCTIPAGSFFILKTTATSPPGIFFTSFSAQ